MGLFADLALLDIVADLHTDSHAWGETLTLADRFRLTLYEAAYLELAQRRALPLATLDQPLRAAARPNGPSYRAHPRLYPHENASKIVSFERGATPARMNELAKKEAAPKSGPNLGWECPRWACGELSRSP